MNRPDVLDALSKESHDRRSGRPIDKQVPPLNNGDRLSRAEFERRYRNQPDIKKAELIEGVVYMPSPVHVQKHGKPHAWAIGWLFTYVAATPGVNLADNATLRLDLDNEPQPDATLWLDEKLGGRAHISDDDYLEGTPELIVEIAATSAAYDLHDKLHAYRRNSVQEYLVLLAYEEKAIWYVLQEDEYHPITGDEQGILRSQVFPGLYFQPDFFWAGDLAGLLSVLQQGLDSPEHAAFLKRWQVDPP